MKARRHRRASFLLFLLAGLIACTCTFQTPEAPTWSVWFTVPLISDKVTMADLADDTDFLDVENNTVIFTFDQEIDPFEVGDRLLLDGETVNFPVDVPDPTPQGSQRTTTGSVAMPGDIVVSQSTIKTGGLTVSAVNTTDYSFTASLTIPSLKNTWIH